MRDKIRDIVVQAVAGTKDLTEAIDELDALLDDRQSEQFFCEHEEVGYNKRCKEQCSDCNWIENL